ncbi:MAG: PKD domain-containing protein [Bacteroidetes bacterium]|nr:PKD domain-containing protein [Bacteroidota bacterium]
MNLTNWVKTSCFSVLFTFLSAITIAQLPHANFSATPLSGCAPLIVDFTDLSTGNPTSWKWTLGNNTTSFLQNPSVTYFNPGTYTVKLVVQNAAGKDSVTRTSYITVYSKPVVDFSASATSGCFPLTVNFSDLSTSTTGLIDNWQWDLGDGNFSTQQNPSHTYTASGSYNVSLRVRNSSGCFQTITRTQYINVGEAPVAGFTNTTNNSCTAPVNIYFQNTSTGAGTLSYLWNFGDGFTATTQNPSHSYNSGTFTASLIVTNQNGCKDTFVMPTPIIIGNMQSSFTSPVSVCAGTSFTINNTSTPNSVSYAWDFGDGTTDNVRNPVKTYATAGTYLIKLVNNFGSCTDSITRMITVLPKPASGFTADVTGSCMAPLTVHFTNSSTGANIYQWNFGDGATSVQQNPVHTYTTPGTFDVTLITTGTNGCRDTLIRTQYIHIQPPVAAINDLPQVGCAPLSWTFTSTNASTEPVANYLWDFGDGTTSTLASPTHVFNAGNYDITLVITTASGCTDTVVVNNGIRAGVPPEVHFDGTPRDVCAEVPVVFTDQSTGTNNGTHYLWDFGDGGSSVLQNPQHTYHDTGYFYIQLIAINNGCPDTLRIDSFVHVKPPIANFLATANCSTPLKRIFTDRSIGADTYYWDFGDGTTSTISNPTHFFPSQGIYLVSLTVTNASTGCSHTKTSNVRIIDESPDFIASDTTPCRNSATTFTALVNVTGYITNYAWYFGDGGSGNGRVIGHTYTTAGWYDVKLITTDLNGCKDTINKMHYIRVNGPTANFASTVPGTCLLSSVNFTDSSVSDGINPIETWIWNYGDGVTDTLHAPPFQHTYSAAGIYTVTLTVVDTTGCSNTIVKSSLLTISRPVAGFTTTDTVTCPNRNVNFVNSSTGPGLTYAWDFGDGGTSIAQNPSHSYAANGNYTVKLVIVDQYGCTDSMIRANYIAIRTPQSNFTLSDTLGTCPPLVVDFVNTSQDYTSFNWDFGDGTTSQSPNPSHFYSIPGVYVASLTVTGQGGCTSVKQQTIVVRGPQGTFTYSPLQGCSPLTVRFVATTRDRISFIWDFNDGSTLITPDSIISHTYTIPGDYVPKMILRDAAGCVVPIIGSDTIHVDGVLADFDFDPQPLCNAGNVQFNNHTAGNDPVTGYTWLFGDGNTSTAQNPSHLYGAPGLYYPKLLVQTAGGCLDSVTSQTPVKVVAAPQALIAQTANGCTPVTVTFNGSLAVADTSAVTWSWDLGNGHTSQAMQPAPETYSTAGTYNIQLLVTNSTGCIDTVRTTVDAYAIPTVEAGPDTLICQGTGKMLQATGALNYSWSPSTGLSCANCANPIATPANPTRYVVTGTTQYGCSNRDSLMVNVQYPFDMVTGPGDTICAGRSAVLTASGAFRYEWSPSVGLSSTSTANVVASPMVTTTYRLIGTDDKHCFSDTAYFPVRVYDIPTVEAGDDKVINVGQQIDLVPTISQDVTVAIWNPTDAGFRNTWPAQTVMPRTTTTYTLTVRNDGGCESSDIVTVSVICNGANIFIPNTFSPNGDGTNDVFYPRGSGVFSIKSERIFTRWGEVVFEKKNFMANDVTAGWDGTFRGKKLNPDVFVYIVEVVCDNSSTLTFKGNIALIK